MFREAGNDAYVLYVSIHATRIFDVWVLNDSGLAVLLYAHHVTRLETKALSL